MKKKILLSILLLITFFSLVGCTSKKEEKKEEEKQEEVVDKTLVKVNGVELHINKEKEFKGIKYTITDDLKEVIQDYFLINILDNSLFINFSLLPNVLIMSLILI